MSNQSCRSNRASRRRRSSHILLTDISHRSTCINVTDGGLPLQLACQQCKPQLDIYTKKVRQQSICIWNQHPNRRCRQYWDSKWAQDNARDGDLILHNRVQNYLGIKLDVMINNINVTHQTVKQVEPIPTQSPTLLPPQI